jgi:hypothetical protein
MIGMHRIKGSAARRLGSRSAPVWISALVPFALVIGCVTPPDPDPESATVWGYVRLVPKANLPASGGGYGDRRLVDVKRFDYSHTKFAVVFSPDAKSQQRPPLELTIRDALGGPLVEPALSASTLKAGVRITNRTAAMHVVSAPSAGWLKQIAPGESASLEGLSAGELSIHLLGLSPSKTREPAQVWLTTGVIAEVAANGRYTLRGLESGPHRLSAWHPRLPPSPTESVTLTRGGVLRADLEIGVDGMHLDTGEAP